MTLLHLTGVVVAALVTASTAAAQLPPPRPSADTGGTQYLVFFRSQPIGREEVLVLRIGEQWVIRGSSRLGAPVDITTRHAEVTYDLQWRPQSLVVDAIVRGQDVSLKTTFEGGKASNVIAVQGTPQSKVDAVSADAVVLPNAFLGSYAALGKRLQGGAVGMELRAYIAPQGEVAVKLIAVSPERMETPKGAFAATRYALTLSSPPPAADLSFNLWTNADGDLLRVSIPAQTLELAREDIASAASRTTAFSIAGDETVQIPAVGFNLAATVTRPPQSTGTLAGRRLDRRLGADRSRRSGGRHSGVRTPRARPGGGRIHGGALRQARPRPERRARRIGHDRRLRRRRAGDPAVARQAKGRRRRPCRPDRLR